MTNKAADGMIKNHNGNMLSKPELLAKTYLKNTDMTLLFCLSIRKRVRFSAHSLLGQE